MRADLILDNDLEHRVRISEKECDGDPGVLVQEAQGGYVGWSSGIWIPVSRADDFIRLFRQVLYGESTR